MILNAEDARTLSNYLISDVGLVKMGRVCGVFGCLLEAGVYKIPYSPGGGGGGGRVVGKV